MAKYKTSVWRNPEGKYLIYKVRDTHTGHHVDIDYTDDIEEATTMHFLPGRWDRDGRHMPPDLQEVEVTITRTVEITDG